MKQTQLDPELSALKKALRKGYASPKCPVLAPYRKIWDSLTITNEGLVLKDDRIIIPEALKEKAMRNAHQGGHPGITAMKRRLRMHFYFRDLSKRVEEFVRGCEMCTMFNPKNRKNQLIPHDLQDYHAWERLAVDLFWPMPDGRLIPARL